MKKSLGQSLVEFAIIVPIFLLLVMGTIEIGRLFYIKIALQNAAREGAYYLSYNPTDISGMMFTVKEEANSVGVEVLDDQIDVNNCCTPGDYVEVVVNQEDVPLLVFGFLTGDLDLSSTARMMVQ